MQHMREFIDNENLIAGLTHLVSFAMLQLHKSYKPQALPKQPIVDQAKTPNAWNSLMSQEKLNLVTGPTVLAVVQDMLERNVKNDTVENLRIELSQKTSYLVTITNILDSQVFKNDSLSQSADAFHLVIFGWLVKAYRFFDSHRHLDKDVQ